MRDILRACLLLVAVLATVGPASAADGNIPVYQQTTLNEPGSYIVTRDFEVTSGYAIGISSDDVVLDLNGHTISNSDPNGSVIDIQLAPTETGVIKIRNGKLVGGRHGISAHSAKEIYIHDVEINQPALHGIELNTTRYFEVTSCSITLPGTRGLNAHSSAELISGRVVDNFISGSPDIGILLTSLANGEVSGNQLELTGGPSVAIGIQDSYALGGGGNRIERNRITHDGGAGLNFPGGIGGNHVTDNAIRYVGATPPAGNAVNVGFPDSFLARNIVTGHRYGISVGADGNHLEQNKASGNEYGLYFAFGVDNSYRNNVLVGNTIAPTGGGALGASIDGGGNIP